MCGLKSKSTLGSWSCKDPHVAMIWNYDTFSLLWVHFCYVSDYISYYISF